MISYDDAEPPVTISIGSESRKIENEFIRVYHRLPLLWDMKHPDYSNKYKRNSALDKLLVILKKLNHLATRYNVRQKINILRSCYRKELRRHLASKVVGPDGEEIFEYIPSSWKFHKLRFLDCNDNEKSESSINNDSSIAEVNIDENNYDEHASEGSLSEQDDDTRHEISMNSLPTYESKSFIETHRKPCKRVKLEEHDNNYLEINTEKEESMDREFDAVGANVACKLKRMCQQQRYHAELLINKVLIKGLKNSLTDDTDLTDVWNI